MPTLSWPVKVQPNPQPAELVDEAVYYPHGEGYPNSTTHNRVIWGDNLGVMAAMVPEYENRLELIYADPPFFTNKNYPARIGRGEDSRHPGNWELADGYPDSWEHMDDYLDFLYQRLLLMHQLLGPNGTLYLHLDWHADAPARLILDEIFGTERFLNEIIWAYHGPSPIRRAFNRKHDTILVYTKSEEYIFNTDDIREPYHPNTIKTFASSPKAGFGKVPDLRRGKVPEDWWYFPVVARLHNERTGYPTQKPEALLARIIKASSNPGGLTADFFCGSGTFPTMAGRLGRNFLTCDRIWRAIHTTRMRLVEENIHFRLERDIQFKVPTVSAHLPFRIRGNVISIGESANLDYWEVDPAWDGKVFHSTGQAYRPHRSIQIPQEMKLPVEPKRVQIRAVNIKGEQITSS